MEMWRCGSHFGVEGMLSALDSTRLSTRRSARAARCARYRVVRAPPPTLRRGNSTDGLRARKFGTLLNVRAGRGGRCGHSNPGLHGGLEFRPRKGAAVAVLVRDPSATTPDDASLNNSRRTPYLSRQAI
jgi:hypothetical protein